MVVVSFHFSNGTRPIPFQDRPRLGGQSARPRCGLACVLSPSILVYVCVTHNKIIFAALFFNNNNNSNNNTVFWFKHILFLLIRMEFSI